MTRSRRQREELDYLRRLAVHVPNAVERIKLDLLAYTEDEGSQMLFEAAAIARNHLPDLSETRAGETAVAAVRELYEEGLIGFRRISPGDGGGEEELSREEAMTAIEDEGWHVLPAHPDWSISFHITQRGCEVLARDWPL
jgi:hypothetical protein